MDKTVGKNYMKRMENMSYWQKVRAYWELFAIRPILASHPIGPIRYETFKKHGKLQAP